jgi:hypothetical protein
MEVGNSPYCTQDHLLLVSRYVDLQHLHCGDGCDLPQSRIADRAHGLQLVHPRIEAEHSWNVRTILGYGRPCEVPSTLSSLAGCPQPDSPCKGTHQTEGGDSMRRLTRKSHQSSVENWILLGVLAAVVGAGSGILVGVVSQHKSNTDTIPIVNK